MSLIAMLALAAGASMVEVELREVEQTVVTPGSVSTAQPRITPVGKILRLPEGGEGTWYLSFGPSEPPFNGVASLQMLGRDGRPAPQVHMEVRDAPRPRWNFSARLLGQQGNEATLRLRWMRDVGHSGDAWSAELRTRLDHWTVIARQHPGKAPPPGSVSTQPVAEIRELQMRVRAVPE